MFFIPIKNKYLKKDYFHIDNSKSPFFSILNHQYTSKKFIGLIKKNKIVEAKNFISKDFLQDFNIHKLKEFFNDDNLYVALDKVCFIVNANEKINAFNIHKLKEFFNDDNLYVALDKVCFIVNANEKINAFLIMDKNLKFKGIINFYMIKEPDNISKWKIYKITKETTF